jgi:sugar-specific transcriptional regulator TrmB
MSNVLYDAFEQIGLSQIEAEIYQHFLNRTDLSLTELANELKVDRVKFYKAIHNLLETELITSLSKGKYSVEPPSKISSLIKHRERQQHKTWESLQELLPDLNASYESHTQKPYFSVYENTKQFMNLFDSVLDDAQGEILFYGNVEYWINSISLTYQKEWTYLRAKRNIHSRMLYFDTPDMDWFLRRNDSQLRKYKILPKNHICKGVFYVYGNTTIQWNPLLPRAIKIQDSIMAETMRSMFETLWDSLDE